MFKELIRNFVYAGNHVLYAKKKSSHHKGETESLAHFQCEQKIRIDNRLDDVSRLVIKELI